MSPHRRFLIAATVFLLTSFVSEDATGQNAGSSPRLEVGGHIGRSSGLNDSGTVSEDFYGMDARLYLAKGAHPGAIDVVVSYHPVDDFISRTSTSFFASWIFNATQHISISGGPGFEVIRESFDFGDVVQTQSQAAIGVRLESKFQITDRFSPIVSLKIMGAQSVYVGMMAGVRIGVYR